MANGFRPLPFGEVEQFRPFSARQVGLERQQKNVQAEQTQLQNDLTLADTIRKQSGTDAALEFWKTTPSSARVKIDKFKTVPGDFDILKITGPNGETLGGIKVFQDGREDEPVDVSAFPQPEKQFKPVKPEKPLGRIEEEAKARAKGTAAGKPPPKSEEQIRKEAKARQEGVEAGKPEPGLVRGASFVDNKGNQVVPLFDKPTGLFKQLQTVGKARPQATRQLTTQDRERNAVRKSYFQAVGRANQAELGVGQFVPDPNRQKVADQERVRAEKLRDKYIKLGGDPADLGLEAIPEPAAVIPEGAPQVEIGDQIQSKTTGEIRTWDGDKWVPSR